MIIKQELFNKVREHFNLNVYETKVWLALLSKGIASAGEVAELSNVPRSRTYDVLEGLEKRGFAIEKLGKPIKFIAVKPVVVLEKMKSDVQEDIKERTEILSNLKDTEDYKQLELLYKQGIEPLDTTELSGVIKGKHNIHVHLKDVMGKASKNVVLVTDIESMKKKMKLLKSVFESLKKKGVDVKVAVKGDEKEVKELGKEIKANVKNTDLDARFCIVDGKEVVFMVTKSDNENDTGVWINSEFFTSALNNLFNLSWNK